jgi:hypothetical protein
MKFAPKVAVTIAVVSVLWNPGAIGFSYAADLPPATSMATNATADVRLSIDARLGRLEDAVNDAVIAGRLTTEEADNYKLALQQIAEEEAKYLASAPVLGPVMRARLEKALSRVEKRFATSQHDRRVAIFDFNSAEEKLRSAILTGRDVGRLSAEDANRLLAELKAIGDLQESLRTDGIISYGDALVVSYRVDHLVARMGNALIEPTHSIPSTDSIASEVSQALSSGKFSAEQSNVLRKEFDALQTELAATANIKNAEQKDAQLLYLGSQFELLKQKIDLAAAGKSVPVTPQDRAQQIDLQIADAFFAGKLNPMEAHELRSELEGIIKEMATDASASPEKTARLALELERTAGKTNRWLHEPGKAWTGFASSGSNFLQRVDDAAKAGRITAEQQTEYKAAADKIIKAEADKRAANGGRLSGTDALELGMQLERLAVALHHDKKDRDLEVPDIDALQKELDKLIAEGISSGRLAADGSLLTGRLNHVAELRSNYEKSTSGLDARAKLAIGDAIAKTMVAVQQEIHRNQAAQLPLDLRLDKLGDMISNAVAGGMLSVERGAQYRAAVDTIYSRLAADRKSDGLSANESIAIASDTELLTAQLYDELRDTVMMPPFIATTMDELRVAIGNAVANGRLTIAQADVLISDLDRRAAAIALADGAQGGLSHGEGLRNSFAVRRLAATFESQLHDQSVAIPDVAQHAINLDTRLANALAAGQLTVPEAQQYKNNLEMVLSNAAKYRETDGGLTVSEAIALALELDQLSKSVDHSARKETATRNVDARESELKKRISSLVAAGRLSQKDADALQSDLDRIEESEAAFRISDEGLNYAEALTLTLDLDRLSTKVESMSKGSVSTLQQPKSR